MTGDMDTVEPVPSKLGTKEYWDSVYETEVANFDEYGDRGEIWFGESSADKMVDWVVDRYNDRKDINVVDIGCGNGHLLFALRDHGFTNLTGLDYSQNAIDLAQKIDQTETQTDDLKQSMPCIKFHRLDVLDTLDITGTRHSDTQDQHGHTTSHVGLYDLALDKGTFDAISLADPSMTVTPTNTTSITHPTTQYVKSIATMLNPTGILLLTSCNWTEHELERKFAPHFTVIGNIPHPVFKFGGATGQSITTIILKRCE